MSLLSDAIWAASPTTERGRPTQLSADPKGERIAYPSNKSVFLRNIDNPALSTQYTGHTAATTVARFAPSGYYVASGDASGMVRVWDCVGEGATKGQFAIVSGAINDVAWDFESKRIIAVGDGRERYGHCITADSGNSVGEIIGHSKPINAVSIRQHRPMRATTVAEDSTIVFMTGVPFKFSRKDTSHTRFVYGVADSPDGISLVTVGADRKILMFDGRTHDFKASIGEGEHTGSIFSVCWSADSKRFVTASADQTVKVWDAEIGKSIQTWRMGGDGVNIPNQQVGVVWPSGRSDDLVISLSLNGNLNYLNKDSRFPTRVVEGHQKSITAMSPGPTGDNTLWTGSYDGRICGWDVSNGTGTRPDGSSHKNQVSAVVATERHIHSTGWDDTLRTIDPAHKTFLGSIVTLDTQPKSLAATSDRVLVISADKLLMLNNNGIQVGVSKLDYEPVCVTASPEGSIVAVAGENKTVYICSRDDAALKILHKLDPFSAAITAMALTKDSRLLAVGLATGKIYVYDTKTYTLKTDRWSAHSGRCNCIAWNDEGTRAVSGALDTNVFVWSLESPGSRVKVLNAHKDGVNGVAWVGKDKVASAGADAAVKIWKLRNATVILPRSGERVKRSVTLRDPRLASDGDGSADHDDDSRTPLLFRRRRTSKHIVPRASWATAGAALAKSWGWATSPLGQSVLKCSIAYLLGSMATFIPALSNFLGHHDGKHMVATVTVYFHSARSQGSMHEATLLAIAATMYASFVAFTSMGLSILFARLGLMVLGHAIVLVVFCGIGLGFVGWLKLRLSNPLVNVACSLTSLTIITVLTKEGSVQLARFSAEKPVQVVKMVLMGIFATTGVCLLLNPISARNELKKSMIDVTDTLGEMMAFVTRNFLYGFDGKNRPSSFKAIESRHNTAMAALTKHLREAKYEHYVWGTERQYHLEVRIVDCMQRLAQNIGGLRSAAATQSAVLDKAAQGDLTPQTASQVFTNQTTMSPSTLFSELGSPQEQQPWNLSSIDELPEENGDATDTGIGTSKPVSEAASLMTISNPGDIFARFIDQLGPSMKSLAYTLKLILDELPFSPHPEFRVTINPHFQHSLDDAQELYAKSRKQALRLLYRSKELNKSRPVAVAADFEEVAASCGHFSFSLQDFADEMRIYLDVLEEYKVEVERRPRERSWSWLKFWQRKKPDVLAPGEDPERMALLERTVDLEMPTNFNSSPQTKPSDKAKDTKARFRQRLYHTLRFFRRDDVKFAIKVGVGAMLYVSSTCVFAVYKAILLALAGRVGFIIIYAGVFYDDRGIKHYRLSKVYAVERRAEPNVLISSPDF
ncbi:MAG: hypothetical protein M1814_000349 [Vezdaea aestivalis]|nr:MAG: hypothetical protein M1814_000349 [Vezdaea aestivalis]